MIAATHLSPETSYAFGSGVLGIDDVWDERNGLLWAHPFEKAYCEHEIAVMYQPSSGTFKLRVLVDKLMDRRLSDYGKSSVTKSCVGLQQRTFAEYDDIDVLLPSGHTPFRSVLRRMQQIQ
ncbi:hypothetical protein WJX82_005169 [Trebouxia sp. C0006]